MQLEWNQDSICFEKKKGFFIIGLAYESIPMAMLKYMMHVNICNQMLTVASAAVCIEWKSMEWNGNQIIG